MKNTVAITLSLLCASVVQAEIIDYDGTDTGLLGNTPHRNIPHSLFPSESNSLSDNTINVTGGGINGVVYGGWSNDVASPVTRNRVNVSGTATAGPIIGGYASNLTGDATASHNTVTISGAAQVTQAITGGHASGRGDAVANNNTVVISGGVITSGVIGGYAQSINGQAAANNNTVTIQGNPTFTGSLTIFGGRGSNSSSDYVRAGNTLNLYSTEIAVRAVDNFQYLNFYVTHENVASFLSDATMLTLTDTLTLFSGDVITVDFSGVSALF